MARALGATEQFQLKSDKQSSNRFVDDFFASLKNRHSQWRMDGGRHGGAAPLVALPLGRQFCSY